MQNCIYCGVQRICTSTAFQSASSARRIWKQAANRRIAVTGDWFSFP